MVRNMTRPEMLDRANRIRKYFREKWAGIEDIDEAREDVLKQFGLARTAWYRWRPELEKIQQETMAEGKPGKLVQSAVSGEAGPVLGTDTDTLEIPPGISPEAKQCIAKILVVNQSQAARIDALNTEVASLKADLIRTSRKCNIAARGLNDLLTNV